MRITMAIDETLLADAQKRAASRHETLDQYIESALRRDLALPELSLIHI